MSLYTKIIAREKLSEAWKRVRKNKPAAGVDNVTYEEFEEDLRANLEQLHLDLEAHTYESMPVKTVLLYKGEMQREISLFSMRDKVVQQAVATELLKLYDGSFSDCIYAYLPGRAALQAIECLEEQIKKPEIAWILKADIKSFFDTIPLGRLYGTLAKMIREQDVMNLIKACCEAPALQKDGTLTPKRVGIYQGSGIAPVLSNIYLQDFDRQMEERCKVYVRYSDDILVTGENEEALTQIREFLRLKLKKLGLALNEEKTVIQSAQAGVDFLGYRLSSAGKAIPAKAEQNLQQRLEEIWIGDLPIREKLQKGSEVLNGWEQYYRNDRQIGSMEEYAVVIYMVRNKDPEIFEAIKSQRCRFINLHLDICRYLAEVWADPADALLEYEQFYEMESLDGDIAIGNPADFCTLYDKLTAQETEECWSDLMQLYADAGAYNKASKTAEYKERFAKTDSAKYTAAAQLQLQKQTEIPGGKDVFAQAAEDKAFQQTFLDLFAGRDDIYGREEISSRMKRCVEQADEPLTEEVLKVHLEGSCTISTYLQRTNQTVKYLVIDVDVSKKNMLQGESGEVLEKYLPLAAETAGELLKILKRLGMKGYLEYSGFRGYHIWVFFTQWLPTRYVNMLTDVINYMMKEKSPDVTVEYFPNKTRMKNGSSGQSIKLPYGVHILTGKRSMLLTDDFQEIPPEKAYLTDIARFSVQALKKIIGANTQEKVGVQMKTVDQDLSTFGDLPDSIKVVLRSCSLMRYLCQKARTTGYLTHFERLSILNVFGHIGDDGKQFVHTVMELTLNYKYHVTEKFIQKLPGKPISCVKLRDQYKQITAEYGCSCSFKRSKNCYPSPVLHAIESSGDLDEHVTIPTSRTISKEKEKQVVEELNVHKKVQELAGKIVEMKKQKRGIDKKIRKTESELEKIFDAAGSDCMEVDMGLLVRRKKDDGYEWLIEI